MSKKSNVCVQFSLPDISPDEILLDCTLRLVLANQKQNHRISYQQSQQFMYIDESVHLCISRTVEPLVAFLPVLTRFLQYSSIPGIQPGNAGVIAKSVLPLPREQSHHDVSGEVVHNIAQFRPFGGVWLSFCQLPMPVVPISFTAMKRTVVCGVCVILTV
jgi:hypothetical protein